MSEELRPLTDLRLRTPRAAAVAGILFAVLLITAYVLIRISIPPIQQMGVLGSRSVPVPWPWP